MAQTQKELRNALRTYKARNGLTWAQVATLLDVAQDTAKKYSMGKGAIPEHIATRLALLIEDENKPLKNRGYYREDFSPIFIKKRIMRTAKAYNANSKSV